MKKRTLLKDGVRWLVGNGNQINFWEDPWLTDKPLTRTKYGSLWNHLQEQGRSKVVDFIGTGRKWKKVELQQNALDGGVMLEELNDLLEGYKILGMD